jgi:tRNA pseudouridine38-40 synthase
LADGSFRFSADPLPAGSRIACRIEYNGSDYSGWQAQPHLQVRTIQEELEHALSVVADESVRVHCAGRTDTGVHGHGQVIHFDAPAQRAAKSWVLGGNANLPRDIRLHWAVPVAADFHARFSATARRYRYVIANTLVRPALLVGQVSWQRRTLDIELMHEAAQFMLGERDFSAFRAAACQSTTPMRNVHSITVKRRGDLVIVDIKANAFLHHMVRNIAGSLMAIGCGSEDVGWIERLLAGRDRTAAADTAAPDGLYLVEVDYPAHYALPPTPYGPLFLGAVTGGESPLIKT